MSEPVIQFDHVSKKFSRSEQHTTLRDFLAASFAKICGRGTACDEAALKKDEFWAVNDVSFELKKGEALGIIGPNGSGKSTTLKLLSGILRPDRGKYSIKGRLSALIEVGAGFHPDLTGRENVYLNGCILGMTRKEINAQFNRIVEFAGVEEFIDTPVKRYSSGMAVRLGFAVSAFIEPDVLLVDEVLAVGDTEFRNRCQNRMQQMRRSGVTMILVSHNFDEVRNNCERTLMLYKGSVMTEGPTQKVLERYHQVVGEKIKAEQERDAARNGVSKAPTPVEILRTELLDEHGLPAEQVPNGTKVTLRVHYHAHRRIDRPRIEAELLWAAEEWTAAIFGNRQDGVDLGPLEGVGYIDLTIDSLLMEPNVYQFDVLIGDETVPVYDQLLRQRFLVTEQIQIPGLFSLPHGWEHRPKKEAYSTTVSGNGKQVVGAAVA